MIYGRNYHASMLIAVNFLGSDFAATGDFIVALGAEGIESLEDIEQGDGGVLNLAFKHGS